MARVSRGTGRVGRLIGEGGEEQLQRFDDMSDGTDLEDEVELWSARVAESMRDESDIISALFADLGPRETVVDRSGKVLDDRGNVVANYPDGLPGSIRFTLPAGCKSFRIESPNMNIVQEIAA